MKLLERYLHAVGRLLPRARRADIIEELRANLLSQMDDREEELGHPLTVDEQAEILLRHGNPTMVASHYVQDNLGFTFGVQLISPALFRIYRAVLGISLGLSLAILTAVMIVVRHTDPSAPLLPMLTQLPIQLVVVTLIFILIDRGKNHVLNRWDPRELPAVKQDADEGPTAKNIFGFLCLVVGTVWLALTPNWPYLMLGPGALYLPSLGMKFFPQWQIFYSAIVALLVGGVILTFFKVFLRLAKRKATIVDLALRAFAIAITVALLLEGPNYVTSQYKELTDSANMTFETCLAIALAIHLWRAGWMVRTLIRDRHQMLPARQH